MLRMTLRFYKSRVAVSVRSPYNIRRASVHLHWRPFGKRHERARPSPTVPDQPTDDHGWRARRSATVGPATSLLSFAKIRPSLRTSVAIQANSREVLNGSKLPLLRYVASVKRPGRCPKSALFFPNAWVHPWRSPNVRRLKINGCAKIVVWRSYGAL